MDLDDTLYKCQPDACAVDAGIEPVEQAEDTFVILRFNANSVITDKNFYLSFRVQTIGADLNCGMRLIAHKLGGIADQVLHYFDQSGMVAMNMGKIFLYDDFHIILFQWTVQ